MKVWIVLENYFYETSHVMGVFSSWELALCSISVGAKKYSLIPSEDMHEWMNKDGTWGYSIEEHEVTA